MPLFAARPPAVCFVCGDDPARPSPSCDHATAPGRLRWVRAPWHDGLLDTTADLVITLGIVAILVGFGPLLWWLTYGWPPTGWIEIFGVLGIALVTLPGAIVSVGLLISLPELRRGRRWDVVDAATHARDSVFGLVRLRRGRPRSGGVSHHIVTPIPAPTADLTSVRAAELTADPRELVLAALLGLAARGQISLTRAQTTSWTVSGIHHDISRCRDDEILVARAATTSDLPWLERTLLRHIHPHPTPLAQTLREPIKLVAHEIGFSEPDDSGPLQWTGTTPPGPALRALLLSSDDDTPLPPIDPAPLAAILADWRARDPEGVDTVIRIVTNTAASLLATDEDDDDAPDA